TERSTGSFGLRFGRSRFALHGNPTCARRRQRSNSRRTGRALLGSTVGRCPFYRLSNQSPGGTGGPPYEQLFVPQERSQQTDPLPGDSSESFSRTVCAG